MEPSEGRALLLAAALGDIEAVSVSTDPECLPYFIQTEEEVEAVRQLFSSHALPHNLASRVRVGWSEHTCAVAAGHTACAYACAKDPCPVEISWLLLAFRDMTFWRLRRSSSRPRFGTGAQK